MVVGIQELTGSQRLMSILCSSIPQFFGSSDSCECSVWGSTCLSVGQTGRSSYLHSLKAVLQGTDGAGEQDVRARGRKGPCLSADLSVDRQAGSASGAREHPAPSLSAGGACGAGRRRGGRPYNFSTRWLFARDSSTDNPIDHLGHFTRQCNLAADLPPVPDFAIHSSVEGHAGKMTCYVSIHMYPNESWLAGNSLCQNPLSPCAGNSF
ncbi:MAG: hypothetical protein KatS3mg029_0437 [Saprospiraceae bacterium]|nr:MAG: hypothetical protein KatS3mg029_0437 [Saprospiraceae bacterium]